MTSPLCTVQDGAGAPQATTNGVNVTPGNVVTIAMVSAAGVNSWSLSLYGQDELVVPPTVTVNNTNKTATFTAPAGAWSLLYRSMVNGGVDVNGVVQGYLSTTFKISSLAAGKRLAASNETLENNVLTGWAETLNKYARALEYDPADFGAKGDGITNDSPAFAQMLAAIPINGSGVVGGAARIKLRPVTYFLADNMYVNRSVQLLGNAGGGTFIGGTVFAFASGKSLYIDNSAINSFRGGDGGDSGYSQIKNITFLTCPLMLGSTWGSDGASAIGGVTGTGNYCGNGQRLDATFYPSGAVLGNYQQSNTTCLFRCTVGGVSAGSTPGGHASAPAQWASTTIAGVTFTDGTSTWISEMIPQDYLVGHAYRVGDRAFIVGNCSNYLECIQAGTSSLALSSFSTIAYFAGSSPAQETVTDGTLKWQSKSHSAVIVTATTVSVTDCTFQNFTNCGIYFLSTTGFTPFAQCDFSSVRNCSSFRCGMSVFLTGFDSNGIRISEFFSYYNATGRSNLDVTTYGAGGYTIYDRSLRNAFYGCYAQDRVNPAGFGGPAYRTDINSQATFTACGSEQNLKDVFLGSNAIFQQSYTGINWAVSSANTKVFDYCIQNDYAWEFQYVSTTNVVAQQMCQTPSISATQSAAKYTIEITGKRDGNHDSYLYAVCTALRGVNNGGPGQSNGTDVWTVTTWGTENSLAGQTFDVINSGFSLSPRVLGPPAYKVNWTISVRATGSKA